jgi:membrane associated rhomboid family serine protease
MFLDAPLTFLLLLTNGAVGAYSLFVDPSLIGKWSFKPHAVRRGEWGRWLTAGFVHVGLAHLAFNMLTLFFFGPFIEAQLGLWRFFALYFGSELAANALTYWRHKDNAEYSAVGASGAIAGVVFSFALFRPLDPIYIMFIPIGIPAALFGVIYLLLSAYAAGQQRGRVAHEAHIGGAVGGLLLTILLFPPVVGRFLAELGLG